jgi:hypothetical protein
MTDPEAARGPRSNSVAPLPSVVSLSSSTVALAGGYSSQPGIRFTADSEGIIPANTTVQGRMQGTAVPMQLESLDSISEEGVAVAAPAGSAI